MEILQKSSRCHQKVAPPVLTTLALQTMLGKALLGYMCTNLSAQLMVRYMHAYGCIFIVRSAVIAALSSTLLTQQHCRGSVSLYQRARAERPAKGTFSASFENVKKHPVPMSALKWPNSDNVAHTHTVYNCIHTCIPPPPHRTCKYTHTSHNFTHTLTQHHQPTYAGGSASFILLPRSCILGKPLASMATSHQSLRLLALALLDRWS